jgi:hypothetical protein
MIMLVMILSDVIAAQMTMPVVWQPCWRSRISGR